MALTGLAMIRQSSSGLSIAGNLGIRLGAVSGANLGTEAAMAWLKPMLNGAPNALDADIAAQSYYSDWGTTDNSRLNGDPTLFSAADWNNSVLVTNDDGTGNEVRYIVERLCKFSNLGQSAPTQKCVETTLSDGSDKSAPATTTPSRARRRPRSCTTASRPASRVRATPSATSRSCWYRPERDPSKNEQSEQAMNHHHSPMAPKPQPSKRLAVCWALVLSSMISTPVLSAQTDISSSPITSTNAAQVKPNIMLLMDTSGSMGWGHMPDEVETQVGIGSIGYKAAQCNVLFYNSTQSYAVPKNADGTLFPTPSFSSARYDAFDTTNLTTVDLSSAFKAYDDNTLRTTGYNDTAQPAYYYTKSGGTVPITGYTSTPCTDADPYAAVVPASLSPAPPATTVTFPSSDGGTWTRTLVGAGEQQNFAIWFTFYRTRILLVKSAASLAFTPLTDSFRVGFITVKPKDNPTDSAINARQIPGDRRLHVDAARAVVCQAVLAKAERLVADQRRTGAGRAALRGQARRHQRRHARGSGAVRVPAELHHHDHRRLLECPGRVDGDGRPSSAARSTCPGKRWSASGTAT